MDTRARLAIFAIVEKEPWDNVTGGWAGSMCRLTHVILLVSIKDHAIVEASIEIECMPLT